MTLCLKTVGAHYCFQHMSPKTMAALTKSPAHGRRSSSGSGLRPVLPFELDESSAIDDEGDDEPELGPMPRESSGPFHAGAGVDEVEYAYGSVTDNRARKLRLIAINSGCDARKAQYYTCSSSEER